MTSTNADRVTRRLIDAIVESSGRLAGRYGIPSSDLDHMAVTTAAAELLRREEHAELTELYVIGYALARRMLDIIGQEQTNSNLVEPFNRLQSEIKDPSDFFSTRSLFPALKDVVSSLAAGLGYPADPTGEVQDIIYDLCTWESNVLKLPDLAKTNPKHEHDFKQTLETSAQAQRGEFENAQVIEVRRLVGGFSNETTLFKLSDRNGDIWDLVARASTGLPLGIEGRDIDGEYYLLRYLHRGELNVAEPIWLECDGGVSATKFLVTRKLEGENFGTVVEAQRLTSRQLGALATQLAKIHAFPLNSADYDLQQSLVDSKLVTGSTDEAVGNYLDRWVRLWRSTGLVSPTIEVALSWLRANLPPNDEAPVLVHGDFALHNIMMQGDEISGVLDWELSHLGDRAEDLAGLLASFANSEDADEFISHYIESGGRPVNPFQLEYFNVFRYFIMYVVMLESQLRFETLPGVHPELLVLGSFVQLPSQRMAQAIANAEKAKTAGQ